METEPPTGFPLVLRRWDELSGETEKQGFDYVCQMDSDYPVTSNEVSWGVCLRGIMCGGGRGG